MTSLLLILPFLFPQDPDRKADLEKAKLFVYDADRGITLRVDLDGRVELTVREEGREPERYSADSAGEFRKKHPEAVRKHGLERYLGGPRVLSQDEFDRWWEGFRRNRRAVPEVPGFRDPFDEDWQKWMEEQRRQFDELRRLFRRPGQEPGPAPVPAPEEPGAREFGVKVGAVPETLRDQLSLGEEQGVLVEDVKPGSVADKSKVLRHDIVLKVDGKAVEDKWQFRQDVHEALGKESFTLEILRAGKRETLKVEPGKKGE